MKLYVDYKNIMEVIPYPKISEVVVIFSQLSLKPVTGRSLRNNFLPFLA